MNTPKLLTYGLLLAIAPCLGGREPKERLILKGNTDRVRAPYEFDSIVFSHDGKIIATAGNGGVKLWDSTSGVVKQTLKTRVEVSSIAFAPDDKLVALGVGALYHGDVEVWKVATGERVWRQKDVMAVHAVPVVFAADGKTLISPEDSTWAKHNLKGREALPLDSALTFWDVDTGKRGRTIKGGLGVSQLILSADGKRLLTATMGYPLQHVELWDVPAGKRLGKVIFEREGPIAMSFAPDKSAAVGLHDRVEFWDVAEGKSLRKLKTGKLYSPARAKSLSFSADGKLLACALEHEVKLWDTQTGDLKASLRLAKTFCLALSPDGRTLATTSRDGMVRLWEVAKIVDRK